MNLVRVNYSIDNDHEKVKNFILELGKFVFLICIAKSKWINKVSEKRLI